MLSQNQNSNLIKLKYAIVREPLIVSPNTRIIDVITQMSGVKTCCNNFIQNDIQLEKLHLEVRSSCVLVVEDKRLLGIFTERDVTHLNATQQYLEKLTVKEVMAKSIVTLQESHFNDLFYIINILQINNIRHLPILDKEDCLVGIVTHESLRYVAKSLDILRLRLVSEVMNNNVIVASSNDSVLKIAQKMSTYHISSIVLVEFHSYNDDMINIPTGILTERDLVQFKALGLSLENYKAKDVMNELIFTIKPNDSLLKVQQIINNNFIGHLVVVGENKELLGIVTQSNLLQALNPIEIYHLAQRLEEKIEDQTIILKKKIERETLLAEIAKHIHSSLNLQTILNICVNKVREFLQCDRVLIYEFQADWSGVIIAESVGKKWINTLGNIIHDSCFKTESHNLYDKDTPIIANNIYTSDYTDCHIKLLEKYQIKANLLVPIKLKRGLWGLLIGHQCENTRNWKYEEGTLFQEISIQLAIALEKAIIHEKLQQELEQRKITEKQLQIANEELQRMATIDGLTKIANRRYFDQQLAKEWKRLQRERQSLSLILFDVDYFKLFNDNYGHQAGDKCLIQIAQATTQVIKRTGDLVARYGGEEFVIILPNTDKQGAIIISEKIREKIYQQKIPHQKSKISDVVSVSLGVSTIIPTSKISCETIIRMADKALYQAKEKGRNQTVFYS